MMEKSYTSRKKTRSSKPGWSDWSDLPQDILALIVSKIQYAQDVCAFQSVCVWWRFVSENESFPVGRKLPMLLQARGVKGKKEMVTLGHDKVYDNMLYKSKFKTWCLGSHGWIFVSRRDGKMYLLHAFSNNKKARRIKLPSAKSLRNKKYECVIVYKAALSSDPLRNKNSTLMVLYRDKNSIHRLAFWRPGDESFTKIQVDNYGYQPNDIISYGPKDMISPNSLFYAVTDAAVVAFDLAETNPRYNIVRKLPCLWSGLQYLVELAGELVIVVRFHKSTWKTVTKFSVYVVPKSDEWKEVHDLGNRAIFIGGNTSFSVDNASEIPGCMPNHIYFTNECPNHMGAYNLATRKVEYSRCSQEGEFCACSHPPLWIQPSFP